MSGLSIRTVNRVLKNQAHVHPEKRELIMRLARDHNYIPNMAARNLRLNCSKFVGILSNLDQHTPEIYIQKMQNLEICLKSKGYYPIIGKYDMNQSVLEKILADWSGIAEFVIVTAGNKALLCELFQRYPLTPIYIDRDDIEDSHLLRIDRTTGIRDAISTLIQDGKKCILHCGQQENRKYGIEAAFLATPANKRPEKLQIPAWGSFENGRKLAPKILKSGADAVFFDTDRMALGFLNYAAEHKIKIPEKIAVIGFDDDPAGRQIYPALSTVAHPVDALNQAILSIIENKPEKNVNMSFPTRFIRRQTS